MKPRNLEEGDVVQINPDLKDCFFRGCFMLVTVPEAWGAQGYVCSGSLELDGEPSISHFRAKWDEMEYVGPATWWPGTRAVKL